MYAMLLATGWDILQPYLTFNVYVWNNSNLYNTNASIFLIHGSLNQAHIHYPIISVLTLIEMWICECKGLDCNYSELSWVQNMLLCGHRHKQPKLPQEKLLWTTQTSETSSHGTTDYLVRGMVTRSDNCHSRGQAAIKMSLGN